MDDILSWESAEVISADHIFEKLQRELDRDLTPKRLQARLLILERLRKQPAPQTTAVPENLGLGVSLPAARAASITVFNVPELLELILSCLPPKSLLISRRVNKGFDRLIATSPVLQKELFLLPVNSQPQYWQSFQSTVGGRIHAAIASSSDGITSPPPQEVGSRPRITARTNPILQTIGYKSIPVADRLLYTGFLDYATVNERMLTSQALSHMYLTNPPCTCVHIVAQFISKPHADGPMITVYRNVYDRAGVTFGAVYETLHKKGAVVVYEGHKDRLIGGEERARRFLQPDTTLREQIVVLEQRGFRVSLDEGKIHVTFCHLVFPSDAEFEEMRRNGCVEGTAGEPEVEDDQDEAAEG